MTEDPFSGSGSDSPPESAGGTTEEEARLRELLRAGSEAAHGDAFSAVFAVRSRVRRGRVLRGGLTACLAAGLVAGVVLVPAGKSPSHTPRVATATTQPAYHLIGALVSFDSCAAYLGYLRSQAMAIVGPYGLQPAGGYDGLQNGAVGDGTISPGLSENLGAISGASASQATSSSGASDSLYSQTDDQVTGVDEPDTVKTNGNIVVTLEGSTLRVLDLQAQVVGSLQLSGDTGGGFLLAGDEALVFSSTSVTGPEPVGFGDPYSSPPEPVSSSPVAQVAVVDLSVPTQPRLVRTFLFDGTIVAARLVDGQVRLVLQTDGPRITFATPTSTGSSAAATAANRALIAGSTLDEWLPEWQIQNPDGSTTALQPVASCDSVARPQQASGLSTLSILSLDPTSPTPGPGTAVVAAGDTVYATADRLYVAGPTGAASYPGAGVVQYGCCTLMPPQGASTRIYAFDTPATGPPVFEGVGSVPGWLINSYAMDEDPSGLLRVASTSQSSTGSAESQITVLSESGGHLSEIGAVGGLGRGEYIRAVRFIGEEAYVVTFQTFDPLYIVDLSNPRHPVLAGQLDQPGFSEFLYPLPGQRLLGVGVELTNGEPSGLIVATYDVANPAHPVRLDSSVLASGYQYVAQGYDPHAFLYWAPVNLALVAVPSDATYAGSVGGSSAIAAYQIGASGQLTRTATLSHGTDLATRSVVIGSQVWAITSGGVVTANLTDLPATTWHSY
jgi:hypothetical protein